MTDGTHGSADASYMRRAIDLAGRGWGRVAPNPLVGAVVVREGRIVGEGWHAEYGGPHAEVEAIRAAGDLARGATLYVTLEPCAHHGRTPPCTEAILAAGIRRVVYGAADPNPTAAGGAEALRARGVETIGNVESAAAEAINRPFFRAHDARATRPWTELKLALSLDGRIADAEGRSNWITGERAREEVHRIRAGSDAIAIGIGTAIADDPRLTVRGSIIPRVPPVRIVFDRSLRLPTDVRLATTATEVPLWLVCGPEAPASARVRLEALGANVVTAYDLPDALSRLRDLGIRSLLVEGGAGLASALLNADLVDRLTLFYAPLLLGADGLDPFGGIPGRGLDETARWKVVHSRAIAEDTMIVMER